MDNRQEMQLESWKKTNSINKIKMKWTISWNSSMRITLNSSLNWKSKPKTA